MDFIPLHFIQEYIEITQIDLPHSSYFAFLSLSLKEFRYIWDQSVNHLANYKNIWRTQPRLLNCMMLFERLTEYYQLLQSSCLLVINFTVQ